MGVETRARRHRETRKSRNAETIRTPSASEWAVPLESQIPQIQNGFVWKSTVFYWCVFSSTPHMWGAGRNRNPVPPGCGRTLSDRLHPYNIRGARIFRRNCDQREATILSAANQDHRFDEAESGPHGHAAPHCHHSAPATPMALKPKTQGWTRQRPTLGTRSHDIPTPSGLRPNPTRTARRIRRHACEDLPRVAAARQPWVEG